MAGVLNYALAGALGGAGQGLAQVGQLQMQQDQQARMLQERQAQDLANKEELLRLRAELSGGVLGRAGSGTRKAGGGGSDLMDELGLDATGRVAAAGAMRPEEVADAVALAKGQTPTVMRELPGPPDESGKGPGQAQVAKYSEGQAQALRTKAQSAFYRAFQLENPGDADKIGKGFKEMDEGENTRRFIASENTPAQAARGVLVSQGKDVYGPAGDAITGQVKPGTVAASTVEENRAQASSARAAAGKYSEEARSTKGKREGTSPESVADDLKLLREQRLQADNAIAEHGRLEEAARKEESEARKAFRPAAERDEISNRRKALAERRKELEDQRKEVTARLNRLQDIVDERRTAKGGKSTAPAPASAPARPAAASLPASKGPQSLDDLVSKYRTPPGGAAPARSSVSPPPASAAPSTAKDYSKLWE